MPKPPNRSSAVCQQKAAKIQDGDDEKTALYRRLNYYATPPWGARAGAEVLRDFDPAASIIWEPACGEGHMASALQEYFPTVYASDIHAHGYGDVHDFLLLESCPYEQPDWVFTNPPFDNAAAFLAQGLRFARRGVALLLRVAFVEGTERFSAVWRGDSPMALCAPFIERLPMVLGCYDPDASTATCMAWFLFKKGRGARPAHIVPIPPGTKDRLHRVDDVRRFAKLAPAPLFDLTQ